MPLCWMSFCCVNIMNVIMLSAKLYNKCHCDEYHYFVGHHANYNYAFWLFIVSLCWIGESCVIVRMSSCWGMLCWMTLCYDIILGASIRNTIMQRNYIEHQNAERHHTKCRGANLWIFQRVIDTFFVPTKSVSFFFLSFSKKDFQLFGDISNFFLFMDQSYKTFCQKLCNKWPQVVTPW